MELNWVLLLAEKKGDASEGQKVAWMVEQRVF
jgi:hypothetical protein